MPAPTPSRPSGLLATATSQSLNQRGGNWPRLWLYALFSLHIVLFSVVIWVTAITTPYLDLLTWRHEALNAIRMNTPSGWLDYLLLPHNEHRLVFVRILTFIDLRFCSGNEIVFIIAPLLAVMTIAFLLWKVMTERANAEERLIAFVIPMIILSSTTALDIALPINCVYPLSLVFNVGAVVLLARLSGSGRASFPGGVAVLLCAFFSPFSNMTGLVIWPVLVWLGWRAKLSSRFIAATIGMAILETSLYLWHDWPIAPSAGALHGVAFLTRAIAYFGVFLGLPFSRLAVLTLPAMALGFCLASLAIALLLTDALKRRPTTGASLVSTGLILIGLGVAAMASLGRTDVDIDLVAPARYSIYVVLLYTGLVMRVLLWLRDRPSKAQQTGLKLGVAFAAMLVLFQAASGLAGFKAARDLHKGVVSWQPGLHDERFKKLIFPDLSFAETVTQEVDAYLLKH